MYLDTEQDGLGAAIRCLPSRCGGGDRGSNAGKLAAAAGKQGDAAVAGGEGDGGEAASSGDGGKGEGFGSGARD